MHNAWSLFDALTPADRAILDAVTEVVELAADTLLFDVGAPGDAAYVVGQGEVRIEVDLPEVDGEGVIAYLGPGEVIGEVALLDGQPRSARAVAHTDVVCHRIRTASLTALASQHPSVVLAVYRALGQDAAGKLRATTARLFDELFTELPDPEVERMTQMASDAHAAFKDWHEERVDALLTDLSEAVAAHATALAAHTVEETGLGNATDKAFKIVVGSRSVAASLVGRTGSGPLRTANGVTEISAPMGVIFALIPISNPVPTAIYKTLIALKTRNALILSFHQGALGTAAHFGEVLAPVLEAHDAPANLIQWVQRRTSRRKTHAFMRHPRVALVLATGGASMVRAAYSSGTPALGVGPGDAPTLVTAGADLEHAAQSIVRSKSFDHGLICGAEHNLVVERAVEPFFRQLLEHHGAAVLGDAEVAALEAVAVDAASGRLRAQVIGQSAAKIAHLAGIERDHPIVLLVVPKPWTDTASVWTREKMAPILSLFAVEDAEEGIAVSERLLSFDGTGHTAIVHTHDVSVVERFSARVPASRVLVNAEGSFGVVGVCTGLTPSCTLGSGAVVGASIVGTSSTDNITDTHLRDLKHVAPSGDPASRQYPPGRGRKVASGG